MASNYAKMSAVEHQGQQQDLLYHVLVNTEADTLNDICNQISKHIIDTYEQDNLSVRLKLMLRKVCEIQIE